MSNLIVKAHPETGLVLTPNSTKEGWSTLRLEQQNFKMSGRIVNSEKRVAFITGETKTLEAMNLKADSVFPVPGKLVVKESTTPFYEGQQPKLVTGTTVTCKVEGQNIYRTTEFTDDVNEADVYVAHDNLAEIKAAQAVQAGVTTATAFDGN